MEFAASCLYLLHIPMAVVLLCGDGSLVTALTGTGALCPVLGRVSYILVGVIT